MYKDIVVALATPPFEGALAVIRASGNDCLSLLHEIFSNKANYQGNHIYYGLIKDQDEVIDEVLVSTFLAPHSFTGEDSFEITCHGGMFIAKRIISLIIKKGARMALKGEFSKRAFLNNKMDLVKAESINDMIRADTELESKIALNSLSGKTSKMVEGIESELIELLTKIEVNIDYPEYDEAEVATKEYVEKELIRIKEKINSVLKDAIIGKKIKDGINIAIIGKPNVGKSSILNALLDEEKAIVTDIEGTTRDIVEGQAIIDGFKCNFLDTAGIRDSSDVVEKIGIEKSIKTIKKADLVILVLDASRELDKEDEKLLEMSEGIDRIIVANKKEIRSKNFTFNAIEISAGNNDIEPLKKAIVDKINVDKKEYSNKPLLANSRHIGLLESAIAHFDYVLSNIETTPVDLLVVDINAALVDIRDILGKSSKVEMVDEIFSRFCLGK